MDKHEAGEVNMDTKALDGREAVVEMVRNQADVVERQLPVILGQAGLADAVEGVTAVLVVTLAQHAQTHALHDGVGKDGAA